MLGIIIDSISTFMYSKLLVILLIGAGIYFTIRTKLPQMRLFKDACKAVVEKPEDENGVSSFQALMVSTASRVGTGNIIGVSSAICIGGFGSVFWMWIIAIIGSASALIESTLAQIYKRKGKDGECYGGPAYYIEAALHCRTLAIIFCISMLSLAPFFVLCTLGVFLVFAFAKRFRKYIFICVIYISYKSSSDTPSRNIFSSSSRLSLSFSFLLY